MVCTVNVFQVAQKKTVQCKGYSPAFFFNILGLKGCKNILLGGDSDGKNFQGEGPFLTYVVYRSFKYPPPIPPRR